MRKIISPFLFLLLFSINVPIQADAAEITPSDVYAQVLRIEQETLELKHQLKITGAPEIPKVIKTELLPRHIWAKTYALLTKITLFREQKNMPAVRSVAIEPQLDLLLYSDWAQCLRVLTELKILEQALGIKISTPPAPVVTGKRLIDVFNKLNQISAVWNVLIGGQITPSYVYAETVRLNEDVSLILQERAVMDTSMPPAKIPNAISGDSLNAAFDVLWDIQRLQLQLGIEPVNLDEFRLTRPEARPQDVFNMVEMLLAELQPLKAKLGMKHIITPVAQYYDNKRPADVTQLLGYIENKLHLLDLRRN